MTCQEVQDILISLDYPAQIHSDHIRTMARWRNGDSETSVAIYFKSNLCIDYVSNEKFSIQSLIMKITGIDSVSKANEWLEHRNITQVEVKKTEPKIEQIEKFDAKELEQLIIPDYSYFVSRGISENVLKRFKSGKILVGKLKNRYIFPVFNSKGDIVGCSARAINDTAKIRWRQIGKKSSWVYPLFLNLKQIRAEKQVILVEGIPDVLSFFESGIENVLCLFGTDLSLSLLNVFLKLNDIKIVISTNSDDPGKTASLKIQAKLLKYFDRPNISINLPPNEFKDFNEMFNKNGVESLIEWKNNLIV